MALLWLWNWCHPHFKLLLGVGFTGQAARFVLCRTGHRASQWRWLNGRGFVEIPVGICSRSLLLPTSCEDAAANEGWQGRGLSLPAWESLLCRERLMLLWAPSQGLFPFQSITGDRGDEEPVCHHPPQGENLPPFLPVLTHSLCSHPSGCAPGEGELPWELDHSWITAGSQPPSPGLLFYF